MEFHMINITYGTLHMRAQTEKTTFSCKDDCTLTKHTRWWTYSALRYVLTKITLDPEFFLSQEFFRPKLFNPKHFWSFYFLFYSKSKILLNLTFWNPKLFGPQFFWTPNFRRSIRVTQYVVLWFHLSLCLSACSIYLLERFQRQYEHPPLLGVL